jgi:glucosamine 6-phosphate synthetase-like amidotransferase/phosphosugar isomerase protein
MFLQVDSTLVEKGLEISPYSTAVYGFLVAVLTFAAFKFYKDYKQEIEHNRASTKEMTQLLTQVNEKLPNASDMAEIKQDLSFIKDKISK